MSAAELVVVAVLAFFTIGVVVGVIAVIAMSAIRRDQIDQRNGGGRAGGLGRRLGGPPGDEISDGDAGWAEPPEFDSGDSGDEDDLPPRWPGGSAA